MGGGEKRISVASITAVQWRKASLATGFIQFTLAGGVDRRSKPGQSGSDAKRDENTVTFGARQQSSRSGRPSTTRSPHATRRNSPPSAAPSPRNSASSRHLASEASSATPTSSRSKARLIGS
ncbi:DUF4429 domain-containing protein [Streptomyces sp. NPDC020983]|uniref:DUF4429 domain-containing protein n=1 Tax=Streptomyces sp. NPDC020983 TaxID=3365106 RepID=UPI00379CD25A